MSDHDIECISPAEALKRLREGARLIDVRDAHEFAVQHARGARNVPREALLADPDATLGEGDCFLLICQSGRRSFDAAAGLSERGFRVASVDGGTARWSSDGLPVNEAGDADFRQRYARHLSLPEVGLAGQQRLEKARVTLIGAGGLGSPAAFYLAAAGVGHLRLVDDDRVERSNLQRQIAHTDERIGQPKVQSAAQSLSALNPRCRIEPVQARASAENIESLLAGSDVVVDGADNFPARYLLNDACVKLGLPLVYGAVHRFEGQASVFDAGRYRGEAPCYRCLFPEPPPADAAPNCSEAGVLGVLPGLIGLIQATEALKLILGIGDSLAGRLLHVDALSIRFRETRLRADPDCPVCAPGREFSGYPDYQQFCAG